MATPNKIAKPFNFDLILYPVFFLVFTFVVVFLWFYYQKQITLLTNRLQQTEKAKSSVSMQLNKINQELIDLQNQDQLKINKILQKEIENIQKTYMKAVASYEKLLDLKNIAKNTQTFDALFADAITLLSQKNYASADSELNSLNIGIQKERDKITASFQIPASVPTDNKPPNSGYKRQQVQVEGQNFMVDIIGADLNSTKVVVDTASESDCSDNCPVLSLNDYVSRNQAFAGVNGSYFCPETYPSCAGKKNSFDTLLMNKNKKYFNSDNNVYSVIPAVIFNGTSVRYVNKSLEWGRDTGVDAVIANYPLLLSDNNIVMGSTDDPKHLNKGGRSFIGSKDSTVYIGVVHNASVLESAKVLKTMGLSFALNLDDGGSTALWSGGYKAGPGRNIPNAILFIRR
jgi:hypothetical protein